MKDIVNIDYRRKREGKTNYKKRLRYLLSGRERIVVRHGLSSTTCQLVAYSENGDMVIFTTSSQEIKKLGYRGHTGNIPCAYLTGLLHGRKMIAKKVSSAIIDLGFHPSIRANRSYACIAGILDAGIKINVSADMLPSKERLSGKDIAAYARALKGKPEEYNKRFSRYLKNSLNPEDLPGHFEDIKSKIKV